MPYEGESRNMAEKPTPCCRFISTDPHPVVCLKSLRLCKAQASLSLRYAPWRTYLNIWLKNQLPVVFQHSQEHTKYALAPTTLRSVAHILCAWHTLGNDYDDILKPMQSLAEMMLAVPMYIEKTNFLLFFSTRKSIQRTLLLSLRYAPCTASLGRCVKRFNFFRYKQSKFA